MTLEAAKLVRTTRPLRPELIETVTKLKEGDRVRISQTVRVGSQSWTAEVTGVFRNVRSLLTGLATDRVRTDDILVPTIHFTKDNGEHSSVTLDENSQIEIVASTSATRNGP